MGRCHTHRLKSSVSPTSESSGTVTSTLDPKPKKADWVSTSAKSLSAARQARLRQSQERGIPPRKLRDCNTRPKLKPVPGQRRRTGEPNMTAEERRAWFEKQPDCTVLGPYHIRCHCGQTIKLDTRDMKSEKPEKGYYPGFWIKHKETKGHHTGMKCRFARPRAVSIEAANTLVALHDHVL